MSTGKAPVSEQCQSPLLEIRGLTVHYRGSSGPTPALERVNLTIGPGQVVGLVGHSGSGKSTLARALFGLLGPSCRVEGHILFEGRDLLALPEGEVRRLCGRQLGLILQEPAIHLNPVMRIESQITEGMRLHLGCSRQEARRRAEHLCQELGLEARECLRAYPHQLSGGMQQRVMIALALASDPCLLVADEPTSNLDTVTQHQILAVLGQQRRQRGFSMLLISHDLSIICELCDRITVIEDGRVVEEGEREALLSHPAHPATRQLLQAAAVFGATGDLRAEELPQP